MKDIISLGKMRKVKDMFREIEHIKMPYSGTELLKLVRRKNGLVP